MKQKLYTVFDEKAEAFLPPFFVPTDGIAKRAFSDCVNSPDHQFGKHPQDYTLYFLGDFYEHDASIVLVNRKVVGNGIEFLAPPLASTVEELRNVTQHTPILTDKASGNSA